MSSHSSSNPETMTPLREMQLLDAHRAGDGDALSELISSYQRRIFGICLRMLGNHEDAADLTHDSLIKVIEGLDSYDGRSKLSTWVYRVSMNCCLSHLRKQKLRRHGSLDEPVEAGGGSWAEMLTGIGEPTAIQRIEKTEMQSILVRAMGMLDPQMRSILVLRDIQELDYQQIADVVGVPVGTVKSRLFRARAALRVIAESLTDSPEREGDSRTA